MRNALLTGWLATLAAAVLLSVPLGCTSSPELLIDSSAAAAPVRCSTGYVRQGNRCVAVTPTPTPTPSTATWTKCADENGTCYVVATANVRYGAGSTWSASRSVTGSIACNNATFGDPAPNVAKECDTDGQVGTAPATTTSPTPTPTTTPTPTPAPTVAGTLGMNLGTIDWWNGARPFMNLIYGSDWGMQNTSTWAGADVADTQLDANGWVKSVPSSTYRVTRALSIPTVDTDIICKWQGNAPNLTVQTGGTSDIVVSNLVVGVGQATFHYKSTAAVASNQQGFAAIYYNVDPANYLRNLDCRGANEDPSAEFTPDYLAALKGFKVVRFMKWDQAVEHNTAVTWAARNKPGDGTYLRHDGVPVEVMVDLANQAGADPFFSVPWNADDNYATQMATAVRDRLAAGHKAYVEASNEVWNPGYPVWAQAKSEGIAEGLLSAEGTGQVSQGPGERYSEKTKQVMALWSSVFSGQMDRLVRVFSMQHVSPYWSDKLLAYLNASQSVDALATAPYWELYSGDVTGKSLDTIMTVDLPAKITDTLNFAGQQKTVAQKYGLRYITYEAGQSVVLPSNIALLTQIERDPRMANLYQTFIGQWNSKVGDTLVLFALNGHIDQYGAWGMVEYVGQPLTAAPKMNAVQTCLAGAC